MKVRGTRGASRLPIAWITRRLQTTRSQVMSSFFGIIVITMLSAAAIAYPLLSATIQEMAQSYVRESTLLASKNLDAKLAEIDESFQRIALDNEIQSILAEAKEKARLSTGRLLSIQNALVRQLIFNKNVSSAELYGMRTQALYPIEQYTLNERIGTAMVEAVTAAPNQTTWVRSGQAGEGLLAVRHIRLLEDWTAGGYLLFNVGQSLFQDQTTTQNPNNFVYLVYSETGTLLNDASGEFTPSLSHFVNEKLTEWQGARYYSMVHTSALTGWTMVSLVPADNIEKPVELFRSVLLVAAGIGGGTALILSTVLSLLITRPLNHVRRVMKNGQLGELRVNKVNYFNREVNELNRTYNKMVEHIHFLINEVYEKERLTNISRIKALQAQINPHFLFNTLEALNWHLRNKDDEETADLIVSLSELFRYTSGRSSKSDTAFLTEELQHTDCYLKLMQLRMQERLEYSITVDAEVGGYRVPRLVLQPIVENAIQHGAETQSQTAHISVHAYAENGPARPALLVEVWNSGPPIEEARLEEIQRHLAAPEAPGDNGLGMGLSNVHERLKLMYGGSYGIVIDSECDRGTRVTLRLPPLAEGG